MSTIIKKSPWISFFNAGGCIPGDTLLLFEDGEILTAKEIIEDRLDAREFTKLSKGEVLTAACEADIMSWNCISPNKSKITAAYKLPSDGRLVEVHTATTNLKLTPEHKVWVDSVDGPLWKKAKDLKHNDHLHSPRTLTVDTNCSLSNIFEWLPEHLLVKLKPKTKEDLRKKLKEHFGNLKKASVKCSLSYKRLTHTVEGLSVKELRSISGKIGLDLRELSRAVIGVVNGTDLSEICVKNPDKELFYALGLIASDGSISRHYAGGRKSYKIRFDNNEQVLIKEFESILRKWVPGSKIKHEKQGKLHRLWSYHYPFAIFASWLGLKGVGRSDCDLRKIFKMPKSFVASFLAGFFDGDGSVVIMQSNNRQKPRKSIEFAIKDYQTAKTIQLLLKRLGIISKILGSINRSSFGTKTMHSVRITTNYDILKFAEAISIKHPQKKKKFSIIKKLILKDKTNIGRIYHAPLVCGKLIRKIRKKYMLRSEEVFDPTFLSMIENGKRVNKDTIKKIYEKLRKKLGKTQETEELKMLISYESYLDPVKKIVNIKTDDNFVYDFNVANTHKYIPEGAFVVSNCNGCTLECFACFNPRYDVTRFGLELKPSAKHADVLLITGIVNKQNKDRLLRIYEQIAEPKRVVAVGTCAVSGGLYKDSYALAGPLDKVIPVNVYVPGCAPRPESIIDGIRKCLNDKDKK